MDYERNQLGQVTALYYPDTTSKSGMQMDFSYTSLGKVDTITRSPDTLVDYDYAGSNVLSRSYPDPTNDVHYTLAYDSFGRVTRHHTYQDGTPDVEIADFNYTYDDNGNILTQDFAHRTSTPDNIYTYDDLDRLTEADYLVGVLTEDEQFTYDLLDNRLTLNNRADSDVVYTHNIANEYATIGGQTVSHDAPGNLSVDANGYKYFYDYENRLQQIKNSSDVVKAAFTYDALGRRIEKIEYASPSNITTRYYYDGWRVLSETNAAGVKQRHYVYGNYLDEAVMLIKDDGEATPTYTDYYYAHDHLFSAVALLDNTGDMLERYEYDAYGKVYVYTDDDTDGIWFGDPDDTTYTTSQNGNPYTFTGQRLDSLDSGNFKVMYYKNRYYDADTGRFLQRDPLGVQGGICLVGFGKEGAPIIENQNLRLYKQEFMKDYLINPNKQYDSTNENNGSSIFLPVHQYIDGSNLYQFTMSNSIKWVDPYGLRTWAGPWGLFDWFAGRERSCGAWRRDGSPFWDYIGQYAVVKFEGLDLPGPAGEILTIRDIFGQGGVVTTAPIGYGSLASRCACQWQATQWCKRCCSVYRIKYYTKYDELGGRWIQKKKRGKKIGSYNQRENFYGTWGYTFGYIYDISGNNNNMNHSNWRCACNEPPGRPKELCGK